MLTELVGVAWARWKIIAEAFGDFQGRLFALVFYFSVFVPFALLTQLTSDPLQLRRPAHRWLERTPVARDLDGARRQF
jgi:hypothetical protein